MEAWAAFSYQGEDSPDKNRGEQYRRVCVGSS